jgi:hypothetical protein
MAWTGKTLPLPFIALRLKFNDTMYIVDPKSNGNLSYFLLNLQQTDITVA